MESSTCLSSFSLSVGADLAPSFGSFVTHGMCAHPSVRQRAAVQIWASHLFLAATRLLDLRSKADNAETKNFIYFYIGQIAILLWKTS